jgi:mutator protein MutT
MSERRVVVAGAILDPEGDRVLAARRTAPAHAAGRWELPGGKVEPGEEHDDALVREIAEELGCLIEVLDWLPVETPIGDTHVLRAATARLVAGEPRPREHDLVRWLAADELDQVDWLEPDRPFLPHLREVLASTGSTQLRTDGPRGIFFDQEDAAAVVDRLRADGWQAHLTRERYHGEDDDEDHPWAVTTDAPEFALEVLVDEYDGWLDAPEADPGIAPEPLDLPVAPARVKRAGH